MELLLSCELNVRPQSWKRVEGGWYNSRGMERAKTEIFYLLMREINRKKRRGIRFEIDQKDKLILSLVGFRCGNRPIDIDNFIKLILDAGQPNIWHNDRQFIGCRDVFVLTGASRDRVLLKVWRVSDEEYAALSEGTASVESLDFTDAA